MPCSLCKLSGHNKTTCSHRFFYVTEYEEEICALMNISINVVTKTIWRCSSCHGLVNNCTCPQYSLVTFDVKTIEEERQCPYCRDPYCTWEK